MWNLDESCKLIFNSVRLRPLLWKFLITEAMFWFARLLIGWKVSRDQLALSLNLWISRTAKGRTRALWDRHLDTSQFFRPLFRLQGFRSITLNIFMIQTLCNWCSCLRVHILAWMLLQDISDRIRLSRTVQRTYLWVLFHLLQGRV